jgi:acyl carrier protein
MWLEWLDPDEVSSIGTDHGAHSGSLARILEATPPEQRHDRLYSFVRDLVANVLGIEPQLVTPRQGLFDLGLTSLSAVEVVNLLRGALEASLPETLVFEFPTARALTDHLAGLLPAVDRTGRVSPAEGGGRTDIVSRLEEMTDEEAEALLLARVKGITGD